MSNSSGVLLPLFPQHRTPYQISARSSRPYALPDTPLGGSYTKEEPTVAGGAHAENNPDLIDGAESFWSKYFEINVYYRKASGPAYVAFGKSNCKQIEMPIIFKSSRSSHDGTEDLPPASDTSRDTSQARCFQMLCHDDNNDHETLEHEPITGDEKKNISNEEHENKSTYFPFLSLPAELRRKIYEYLLPPSVHKIVTQRPYNGSYYGALESSTSGLLNWNARTLYPATASRPDALTTYKRLNNNFARHFPPTRMNVELLRTCRVIRDEAEEILYGSNGVVFDFEADLEAVIPFWNDRGELARKSVRTVHLATQNKFAVEKTDVRHHSSQDRSNAVTEQKSSNTSEEAWEDVVRFMHQELTGLRLLNLTVWATATTTNERVVEDWAGIKSLLDMKSLSNIKLTWWDFQNTIEGDNESFDGWLARKMVADPLAKDRIISGGHVEGRKVIERIVTIPGKSIPTIQGQIER